MNVQHPSSTLGSFGPNSLFTDLWATTDMFIFVPKHRGIAAHVEPSEGARGLTRTQNACQGCKVRKAKVSRVAAPPPPPPHR